MDQSVKNGTSIVKNAYETAMSHQSIRQYKPEGVSDEDLKMILEAAIHGPSSVNGQQWSVIVIKDQAVKEKLSHLTALGDMTQDWIAQCPVFLLFVMDYYKLGKKMEEARIDFGHLRAIEATMVGCVDIGIAFSNAMNVAEGMGYGICPIGAVRARPEEVIELLQLPKGTYPILGMCLGVPDQEPGLKPRMPYEAYVHEEVYNRDTDQLISAYDKEMEAYMDRRSNGEDIRSWSKTTAAYYEHSYYPHQRESLKKQGFTNE